MLSGGNPTGGANPVGVGQSLNYIGDKAYAYSGEIQLGIDGQGNPTTMLKFSVGSTNIDCKFAIQNGSGSGDDMKYQIKFDGQIVAQVYGGTSDVFNQFQFPLYLIIPAFTDVEVIGTNISSSNNREHTVTLVGQVF